MSSESVSKEEKSLRISALVLRWIGAFTSSSAAVYLAERIANHQEIDGTQGVTASAALGLGVFALSSARTSDNAADAVKLIEQQDKTPVDPQG